MYVCICLLYCVYACMYVCMCSMHTECSYVCMIYIEYVCIKWMLEVPSTNSFSSLITLASRTCKRYSSAIWCSKFEKVGILILGHISKPGLPCIHTWSKHIWDCVLYWVLLTVIFSIIFRFISSSANSNSYFSYCLAIKP